jgi:hypothetical protein
MFKSFVAGVAGIALAMMALPASAAESHFQGDLCGNKVDVVLKTPGPDANPKLKEFFGVWGNGRWTTGTCAGLIVSEINGDKPVVSYYYGSGADAAQAGVYKPADPGLKSSKWLLFHSSKGYEVSFEPVGAKELKGWFGSVQTDKKLQKLQ